jgi:hypothetical protein
MSDDVNEMLMGGGARAFPFDNLGDAVEGEIVSMTKRQQTGVDDGKPQYWDNGDPKMMIVVVLQTSLRNYGDEDDGQRSIYLRGGNPEVGSGHGTSTLNAVRDAVKRSGAKGLEPGGILKLQWSGNGVAKRGFTAAKLYSAAYRAPSAMMSVDELG